MEAILLQRASILVDFFRHNYQDKKAVKNLMLTFSWDLALFFSPKATFADNTGGYSQVHHP